MALMGLLIAAELLVLLIAMNTFSTIRAFALGEGLWLKAQKEAVINLQRFVQTQDAKFYNRFLHALETPAADKLARYEIMQPKPNLGKIALAFQQGGIEEEDIEYMIQLMLLFRNYAPVAKTIEIWSEGDRIIEKLSMGGREIFQLVTSGASSNEVSNSLNKIYEMNDELSRIESSFSTLLGRGSRDLQNGVVLCLSMIVLTVEAIGFLTVLSFNRGISKSFSEIAKFAEQVRQGESNHKMPIHSKNELGKLATTINKIVEDLNFNMGKRLSAENANRVKSRFLANMSHEIRTPLGAIVGFAEILKNKKLSLPERDRYIEIIHRTSGSLTNIIDDILDLSKVEAGHIEIDKINFSIKRLLKDIENNLSYRSQTKNVGLIFEKIGAIPDLIYSDPIRIRQILMNLIGNAIKFTNCGQVKISYEIADGNLQFTIADTGIGISEEQGQYIFQSFRQVDSSNTRRYEGTGLGLILSRKLAKLLDGSVTLLESEINVGSTFVFYFSLESIKNEPMEVLHVIEPTQINKTAAAGKSILLIDDVEDNRILIQHILHKHGMRVSLATNGAQGVDSAMSNSFDLILMDIQMPVMDGYEATQRLRKLGYTKPIIALTAHAMKEDRVRCIAAGCNDYFTKPIHAANLIARISALCESAEMHLPSAQQIQI